MQFISDKEFKEAEKIVQEELEDAWEFNVGDLYMLKSDLETNPEHANIYAVSLIQKELLEKDFPHLKKEKMFHLWTEGELRTYIEKKTGNSVDLDYFANNIKYSNDGYKIRRFNIENEKTKCYPNLGHSAIHAYWQVTQKVARMGGANNGKW